MIQNENAQPTVSTKELRRPKFWRSLSEYHGRPEFQQYIDREFPVAASEFPEGVSRRRWMKLMGASLAMAGVAGCRYPEETIAPFVIRPEGRTPGEAYHRATNFELAGRVYNALISCVDGRPLHVEANRKHPSGGGVDVYASASILGLFDPDRSRGDDGFLLRRGEERRMEVDWDEFDEASAELLSRAEESEGSNLAVLMPPTHSPSIVRMAEELKAKLPKTTIARYDGVGAGVMASATKRIFGTSAHQSLDLSTAKVIVALQSDLLSADPGFVQNSKGFSQGRDPDAEMNRLYVVEGGFTGTGAAADSRLALRPGQMAGFLAELTRRIEKLQAGETHDSPAADGDDKELPFDHPDVTAADRLERYLEVVAHDLFKAGEQGVVVVGDCLGEDNIAAGIALNEKLGSLGKIQSFLPNADAELDAVSLSDLVKQIGGGGIDTLFILGDNPVVASPGDLDVTSAINSVEHTVYLGDYDDETGAICEWSLPLAHPLESWGDVINTQGHYGVCQPQILPLMGGRTIIEFLAKFLGLSQTSPDKIVRMTADKLRGNALTEREWRMLLHEGHASDLHAETESLKVTGELPKPAAEAPVAIAASEIEQDDFEVIFTPADGLYDGRFANNGWLQELPQSITKLTWDNAAIMSPATADALGVKHEQSVTIRRSGAKVELPVFLIPGCAPGVVSTAIGYGRSRVGNVGGNSALGVETYGVDVSPVRTTDAMHIAYAVEARPNFKEHEFATTQDHWAIDERGLAETESRSFTLIREGTKELYDKLPEFSHALEPHAPSVGDHGSLHTEPVHDIENGGKQDYLPQWGMSIDLAKCTGCNVCVIACQSENNVPIVGKEQVKNSREMHWLRIDRYFQGDETNVEIVQQPVACTHCETAPCEQVCPVAATVHTEEGINAMAYNRCIGTRYCANNCPLKVRRFNYFNYNEEVGEGYGWNAYPGAIESANRKLQALVLNPEVTVRGRGVMEKCTYCIQRVEKGKIEARKRGTKMIQDGDVLTACQVACPSSCIEFGNLADPKSKVAKKHKDVRAYGLLEQLNLKSRTQYLASVKNVPSRLMTTVQLVYLDKLKAPHHGHDDGEHGHDDDHTKHDGDHGHDDGHENDAETATAEEKH